MPTHFTNGISDTAPGDPLYEMGQLDPTNYLTFWDDFIDEPFATEWTITAVSAGTGTSAISTPDTHGGMALITSADAENDGIWAQKIAETFLMASGKKTWIKTRLSISDATQSDWIVGLHSTSTTPLAATMRFLFKSEDGAATVEFNNDNNTTDSDSDTVATMSDATFVTLGAYYDGVTSIKLYADGVLITTMTGITVPAAEMAVGFGAINGSASVETTNVDYILVAQER
ncbi:MAG: hypothetical protein HOE83_17120 [Alphaproteobacteria bacterium]|jgi:hypothetical protein|nr:hypothetical protein [Alphaproteobacteria bacterium]